MTNTVDIVIKATDQATSVMQKVKQNGLAGLNSAFQSVTGVSLTAAGAITAVATAVNRSVREYVDYAEQVRNMARDTGMATEQTSMLIQAADDVNLSFEKLSASMKIALKKGFDVSIEGMERMADEYLLINDENERAIWLTQRFGRAGYDMGKLLEQGSEGIAAAAEEAQRLGLVMSQEQVQKARNLEIAMDNLDDAMSSLKMELAEGVIPAATKFFNLMADGIGTIHDVRSRVQELNDVFAIHEDEMLVVAKSYKEYAAEMVRAAVVSGKLSQNEAGLALAAINLGGNIDILSDRLGIVSEAQFAAAKYAQEHKTAIDGLDKSIQTATFDSELWKSSLNKSVDSIKALNTVLDEGRERFDALDDIDLNIADTIKSEMDKIEFYLAGGGRIQTQFERIRGWLETQFITPQTAQRMFANTYLAAQALEVRLGNISAYQAGINISQTLGMSLTDAEGIIDRINAKISATNGMRSYAKVIIEEVTIKSTVFGGVSEIEKRASGGPVYAGQTYIVGEVGPEIFTPAQNGAIIPNSAVSKQSAGFEPAQMAMLAGFIGNAVRDAIQG